MLKYSPVALLVAQVLALPVAAQDTQETSKAQHEHDNTEVIVITASPLARTELNSAQPISVISGDELREKQAHTLGETLAQEPGINATHFARVASSPVIRGLDGPRVKITQNGLDTGDVSRGSPDHAVTTETSVAEQIEILRGPATLLYGSGAIGGVVNVVDERIAQDFVGGTRGFFGGNLATVDDLRDATFGITSDVGNTVWHFDGFTRSSDDYSTPTFLNEEGEAVDSVENSFVDAMGGTVGVSYILDNGFIGASYARLEQEYGIPGHAHHEEEHEDEHGHEEEHADEHDDHEGEVLPYADLVQDRVQLHAGFDQPFSGIEKLDIRYAFTDYQHQEIEGDVAGTTFTNEQHELRVTANHHLTGNWYGAIGYHGFDQQQAAFGEEAYTPASDTTRHGFFWLAETRDDALNWQTGIRYELVDISAPGLEVGASDYEFKPFSASFGVSYQWHPLVRFNANLSHAERAPSANELFANGQHLATRTYELGLNYELHEEGDHAYVIEAADRAPALEKSNTLDLGTHIEYGDNHLDITLFVSQIDNFIFENVTSVNSVDLIQDHGHEDEHEGEHEGEHEEHAEEDAHDHSEGLPVVHYQQVDALLFGYEISGLWQLTDEWKLTAFSDYTRAYTEDSRSNLPRIPQQRLGSEITYNQGTWEARVGYIWHAEQNRVAINETPTPSFGLLNAQFNYFPQTFAANNLSIYVKADNLTDKLGYVHTSFLKEQAPLAGRNFSIGIRGEF
ncbi:membrane protein [Pseudidiomarina atlantica]|uniref:Membrane protein n=1 Tax=Pseudidiomarina atlantica TaxID=1517416 RepID=A0A094IM45_9GAMM|nr:TonB-dependent receptor [Pseudidiomarina atlantica]KFZ28247.1 membrane protein [Pseudidiomarina atlantica]